ncbi:MAG: hypothetical protein KatS3mg118_3252 [Paracoccaceae bacterium]|nr:MAG: hypothetical protein KatS3mg118_3252 [Paracoccaceae bacterium]
MTALAPAPGRGSRSRLPSQAAPASRVWPDLTLPEMASAEPRPRACPAVGFSVIGSPCPSVTAWILMVRPPRERPMRTARRPAGSAGPAGASPPLLHWLRSGRRGSGRRPPTAPSLRKPLTRLRMPDSPAQARPADQAVAAAGSGAVALGDAGPGRTGPGPPADTARHPTVIQPGNPARPVRRRWRDDRPREAGQRVARKDMRRFPRHRVNQRSAIAARLPWVRDPGRKRGLQGEEVTAARSSAAGAGPAGRPGVISAPRPIPSASRAGGRRRPRASGVWGRGHR